MESRVGVPDREAERPAGVPDGPAEPVAWTEAEWIVDQRLAVYRVPMYGDRVKLPREICEDLARKGLLRTTEHNKRAAMLGHRVRVMLVQGDEGSDPRTITEGVLLGFGDGGDFEVLESDGMVHYCWPMLEIEQLD